MAMKQFATCALMAVLAIGLSAPTFAGEKKHHHKKQRVHHEERYVPAGRTLVEMLFGGPRYYDKQMFTTAAGPCAYHRVGPDAYAVNDINDRYCGK
ncbi:MAG: hypothetical protein IKE42_11590 [Aquamicrobium sp.]|uniref:hypothetical protein n=1 Tax=Mesorhizobium sp. Pch-S TaxID=2082387 RepID=UPI0010105E50|nr:hypothetical protein [Mesorhizobium sp. Pch-S]MBR2688489.1 hypothetical protein [Aquamicrobium sp.]QAZ45501.1 hypothetical protein C1M53_23795 [Mesorhizobium sp. Pch-S]